MNFQIYEALVDFELLPISKESSHGENITTILIGKNATGKTRALSKIVNSCLFSNEDDNDFFHHRYQDLDSSGEASQVIAISNSRFDRFPDPTKINQKKINSRHYYHYLGLSNDKLSGGVLEKCASAFFRAIKDEDTRYNIIDILEYVGFLPAVQLDFKRPFEKRHASGSLGEQMSIELLDAEEENPGLPEWKNQEQLQLISRLEYIARNNRNLSFSYNPNGRSFKSEEFYDFAAIAAPLVETGVIKLRNITFYSQKNKDKITFQNASSGQQCILRMLLGLSSVLKDDSLVCIDEPEISLHPRWQSDFIFLLRRLSNSYRGCHFIVATHSPQIVSGLSSENSYVVDMERREIHESISFAKRSADFQLAEVFEEPGFKNEYLIRILLGQLSKISKGESLSSSDERTLDHIYSIKHRLSDHDPVSHLLDQVITLSK